VGDKLADGGKRTFELKSDLSVFPMSSNVFRVVPVITDVWRN